MQIFTTFFIFVRLFDFMNYRSIARLSQELKKAAEIYNGNPDKTTVIFMQNLPTFFMFNLLSDILYLFYCLYLMFNDDTWTPGVLLLIIAALESYAFYAKVDGTCFKDKDNYFYPTLWWRYLCTGSSIFILTRLLQIEKLLEETI